MSDVIRDFKWLSASNLALYHRMCTVRTIVQTGQPSSIGSRLEVLEHGHDTRQAQRLRLPGIRTEAGRQQLVDSDADAYGKVG